MVQLRTFMSPVAQPRPHVPLVKAATPLGWQLVRIQARCFVEVEMPPEVRKKVLYENTKRFLKWQEMLGLKWRSEYPIRLDGPLAHLELREPHVDVGDAGAKRLRARSISEDMDPGKEDYTITAYFLAPEQVQLMDRETFEEVNGKRGIRAYRRDDS